MNLDFMKAEMEVEDEIARGELKRITKTGNKANPVVQELIKEWREFICYWDVNNNIIDNESDYYMIGRFDSGYKEPQFQDFMQWLSDKYKE